MDLQLLHFDRRHFLGYAASVSLIAAHRCIALGNTASAPLHAPGQSAPRILSLELLTSAPLAEMKEFYHRSLGLGVVDERPNRLSIVAGETRISFVKAKPDAGQPFYHFAFNIPENKLLAAHAWQKKRSHLLPIPARLRDPNYPDDVVDYRHWNAHSIFFLDPGGNVVEYIARHDLKNAREGPFETKDILYASEIGLIVDDVPTTAETLKKFVGLEQYRGGDDHFRAIGDEHGLLLVMKRGRILNFNPSNQDKAARVYPTVARVHGVHQATYLVPQFPYEVSSEV